AEHQVADFHVWSIGPGIYAAEVCVVGPAPAPAEHYKSLIPAGSPIVHATVEVQRCGCPPEEARAGEREFAG
ncbi:MAG: hypothetical protein MI723_10480, partial [Caulobacterales bacterium]|nr:hypothetical protein [Caulobacterales bacterium]